MTSIIAPKKVRANLSISSKVYNFLKFEAKKQKRSQSDILEQAIGSFNREKIRQKIKDFYKNPAARKEDFLMSEESLNY